MKKWNYENLTLRKINLKKHLDNYIMGNPKNHGNCCGICDKHTEDANYRWCKACEEWFCEYCKSDFYVIVEEEPPKKKSFFFAYNKYDQLSDSTQKITVICNRCSETLNKADDIRKEFNIKEYRVIYKILT